jgi:hypothetical protein
MKYVAEERTVQVPRVVEKKTPYTYTVRMPRTVVTKVPLDPCGNPLPVPAAPAPAAAARPAVAPATAAAPSLSQQSAAGPVKTFSDRPADAAAKAESGWGASNLPHVDPSAVPADGAVRAERPAAAPAEAIPSPAPRAEAAEPTVAPIGPSVEPAPPAHDQRDVPATGTSGRPILRSLHSGQTT